MRRLPKDVRNCPECSLQGMTHPKCPICKGFGQYRVARQRRPEQIFTRYQLQKMRNDEDTYIKPDGTL